MSDTTVFAEIYSTAAIGDDRIVSVLPLPYPVTWLLSIPFRKIPHRLPSRVWGGR